MASVTGLTASRMKEIEAASVVGGYVDSSGQLVLVNHAGDQIVAGTVEGPQGVPGPPGKDGTSRYTWLKYADTPVSGMSDDPSGKAYIGLAYNKLTPIESSIYSDYSWALIKGAKGDQGVPGEPGPNGESLYTWVKYAISKSGAGMSDDPTGKLYIGLAYNKTVQAESSNPADYTWALIKGEDGEVGPPGPAGDAGVSVVNAIFYYKKTAASAPAPAKPTTNPPDGTWSSTEPDYEPNTALWTVFRVLYSDGTFSYSNVSKSASYRAATVAMDTANGKNKVTYSTSNPSGTAYRDGDLWFKYAGSVVVGMWFFVSGTWVSRALDNNVIATLDAGKVTAGILDADRLGANSITVGKLVIGDFTNLFANAQWRENGKGWVSTSGVSFGDDGFGVRARLQTNTGNRVTTRPEAFVSVQRGEIYYVKVSVNIFGGFTAGTCGLIFERINPDSGVIEDWQEVITFDLVNQPTKVTTATYITIPENNSSIQQIRPYFYLSEDAVGGGAVKFYDIQWRRMASGELIVDGSVTANKLNAAEIWASSAWIDVLKTRVITTEMVSNDFGASISLDDNGSITLLTQATKDAKDTADEAGANAASAGSTAQEAKDAVDGLGQFYRFTSEAAVIGEVGSNMELRLENDQIGIYQSGTKVTWWDSGQFRVTSAVLDEAVIGNHKIEAYGSDRTIFRKV